MLADSPSMTAPGRTLVRNLFLRLLGIIVAIAFWSLGRQVLLLYGDHGLLPACPVAKQALVTVFRFGLALGLASRWLVGAAWLLYLSYVAVGQDFLSFQWDNLLLESTFFALF